MAIWGRVSNQIGTVIAYGNGLYIAGYGDLYSSPDLINWTLRYTATAFGYFRAIVWNGSVFVAVADSGKIITSINGTTWTERASGLDVVQDVIWTGTQFVACGTITASGSATSISVDGGITWVAHLMGYAGETGWGIIYGDGIYVAGSDGHVTSSTDAIAWTTRYTDVSFAWGRFAYGNGVFVAVPASSNDQVLVSNNNGTSWAAGLTGIVSQIQSNKFANGKFTITGINGDIKTSTNGVDWVSDINLDGFPSNSINNTAWDGTKFVAVGDGGVYRGDYLAGPDKNLYYSWSTNPVADISFVSPNRFHVRRGVMFMDNIKKTVYETFPIVFEFDDFILTASETIANYTVACINTATGVDTKATIVLSDNNATPKINVVVQAGTIGETHKITVSATTNFGSVYELDCTLDIVETRGYDMFMKQPGEKKTLSNDFTKDLAGDTITSSTIAATKISDGTSAAGILNTSTNGAATVVFGVQAGDDGEFYSIAIKIVSALGYKYQKDLLMNVRAI